jgi:hypothetical protein
MTAEEELQKNEEERAALLKEMADLEAQLAQVRGTPVSEAVTAPVSPDAPAPIQDAPPAPLMEPAMSSPPMPYFGPAGNEQHASSFIAPNVSDFGEVISPAVDSSQSDALDNQRIVRMQGQNQFQQLVAQGVPEEEAFRKSAPMLLAGASPDTLAKIFSGTHSGTRTSTTPQPPAGMIQAVPVMGADGKQLGHGVVDAAGKLHNWVGNEAPKRPLDSIAVEKNIGDQIAIAKSDLRAATSELTKLRASGGTDDAAIAAANAAISNASNIRKKIEALETQRTQNSTNWQGQAQSPSAPQMPAMERKQTVTTTGPDGSVSMSRQAPTARETANPEAEIMVKVVAPDGRTGTMPKSKLEAAKKAGYKVQ